MLEVILIREIFILKGNWVVRSCGGCGSCYQKGESWNERFRMIYWFVYVFGFDWGW